MKKALLLLTVCWAILPTSQAQVAQTDAGAISSTGNPPQPAALVDIGPNSRTWMRAGGNPIVELATGMNYVSNGIFVPSQAFFAQDEDGSFSADQVAAPMSLSPDINVSGAIQVTTPEGLQVASSPVSITIYDATSGALAVVGSVTNSLGVLVETNQVLYPGAFTGGGICADVLVEVDQGQFSQDVIFTGRFDPSAWGFSTNDRLRVQIWSEITPATLEPDIINQPIYVEGDQNVRAKSVTPDLMDQTIGIGELVLGLGYAYTTPSDALPNGALGVAAKELVTVDNRLLLVESVDYDVLAGALASLPDCGAQPGHVRIFPKEELQQAYASIPSPAHARLAKASARPKTAHLAKAQRKPPGVTIDYIATIGGGTLTNTTLFASDTNYFISGAVVCNGPVIMESTILKYMTNASLKLNNTLTLKVLPQFRPVVLTAEDDNTIGDSCSGLTNYTGVINANGYANPAIYMGQTSLSLTNFRFCYAQQAIRYQSASGNTYATLNVSHSQFVNCIRGIEIDFAGSGAGTGIIAVNVNNALASGVQYPIYLNSVGNPVSSTLLHCTVDQSSKLIPASGGGTFTLNSTNSIYSNVTNSSSGVTLAGGYNGFLSAAQFGANQLAVSTSPFQSVGAGNYYLSDLSGFRDAATVTGIPSWLSSDLRKRTTCPPTVLCGVSVNGAQTLSPQAQRDTDAPDLGYHYDPTDWCLGWVYWTNSVLTVGPGTVLAMFGTNGGAYGLAIGAGATLQSQALPTAPNWVVQYNLVQEQPITSWFRATNGLITSEFLGTTPAPVINCRFTDWAVPCLDSPAFIAPTNSGPFNFRDCEFHGGKLISSRPTINLTNCMLERVVTDLEPKDGKTAYVRNCLVLGQAFTFAPTNSVVQDNLFDSPAINNWNGYTGGYNAYVTNLSRLQPTKTTDLILTSSPSYQLGPLGVYYLQVSSSLINADTTTTADTVMLYHYTLFTNIVNNAEVKETNSLVDISYHWVATDTNGVPLDSDGDGLFDAIEDTNGDGVFNTGDLSDWKTYNSPNGLAAGNGLQVFTPLK